MTSEIAEFRAEKDALFRDSDQSPLTFDQQEDFDGLRYFDEDDAYDVVATLVPLDAPDPVTMITSRGSVQTFYRIGRLHFSLPDGPAELTLYQDTEGQSLFLPFRDGTSGEETYDAGRYIEVEPLGEQDGRYQIRVNFNLAYNPYCAYNEDWVCPVPPRENYLELPIRAGEKVFHT